jgi:hypothetical protein
MKTSRSKGAAGGGPSSYWASPGRNGLYGKKPVANMRMAIGMSRFATLRRMTGKDEPCRWRCILGCSIVLVLRISVEGGQVIRAAVKRRTPSPWSTQPYELLLKYSLRRSPRKSSKRNWPRWFLRVCVVMSRQIFSRPKSTKSIKVSKNISSLYTNYCWAGAGDHK